MSQQQTHEPQPAPAPSLSPFALRAAFIKSTAARAALEPDDFWAITVDVSLAVQTVLIAHPRIQALREQLAMLPVDLAQIDELETYARATGHALVLHQFANAPPERLEALYQEALRMRCTLKADVTALTAHGLIGKETLGQLKNDVGYRNVAYDVLGLVETLRNAGSNIVGRCATLPTDLDAAESLANELLQMVTAREKRPDGESTAETRQRAFSLMARAYNLARQAIAFLRWDYGDADEIAPALYGSKATRKREPATRPGSEVGTGLNTATPNVTAAQANTGSAIGTEPSAAVPGAMGGSPYV